MTTTPAKVTAAVMIIGDEILSGRTQDTNLNHIAKYLGAHGVDLAEARVVPAAETLKARFGDWIVGHVVTYEMHAEPAAASSSSSS